MGADVGHPHSVVGLGEARDDMDEHSGYNESKARTRAGEPPRRGPVFGQVVLRLAGPAAPRFTQVTASTTSLMVISDQISKRQIGNGMFLVFVAGIVAGLSRTLGRVDPLPC
jgi:hypothetical protein